MTQNEYVTPSPVLKMSSQRYQDISCVSMNDDNQELKKYQDISCVSMNDDDQELKRQDSSKSMLIEDGNHVHLQPTLGIIDYTQMPNLDDSHIGCDVLDKMRNSSELGFKMVHSHYTNSGNVLLGENGSESCRFDSRFISFNHNYVNFDASLKTDERNKGGSGYYDPLKYSFQVYKRVNFDDLQSEYVLCGNKLAELCDYDSGLMCIADHNMNNIASSLKHHVHKDESNADACVSQNEVALLDNHRRDFQMCNRTEENPEIEYKICRKVIPPHQALRGHGLHCPVSRRRFRNNAAHETVESRQSNDTCKAISDSDHAGTIIVQHTEGSCNSRMSPAEVEGGDGDGDEDEDDFDDDDDGMVMNNPIEVRYATLRGRSILLGYVNWNGLECVEDIESAVQNLVYQQLPSPAFHKIMAYYSRDGRALKAEEKFFWALELELYGVQLFVVPYFFSSR